MGHAVDFFSFDENTSKNKIFNACYEFAEYNYDRLERSENPIYRVEYLSAIANCYEDAEEMLERKMEKILHGAIAVRYKSTPNFKPSAKLAKLKEKHKILYTRINELSVSWKADEMKSQTIACKRCNSKLATAYMSGKYCCPLCHNDLRPQTLKDRIDKAKLEYNKISLEIKKIEKEETIKHNEKSNKLKWLVMCDVHC